jgi:hypothetical protein
MKEGEATGRAAFGEEKEGNVKKGVRHSENGERTTE